MKRIMVCLGVCLLFFFYVCMYFEAGSYVARQASDPDRADDVLQLLILRAWTTAVCYHIAGFLHITGYYNYFLNFKCDEAF